ncbi:MAG: DNA polymerase III subunit delta [Planctomycetia bacterium]|nr:DNA polymerase III subunit delta [Planctomycetia bacterium]
MAINKTALKTEIHPVMVLAGTESFLRRQWLERIRDVALDEASRDSGYIRLEPNASVTALLDECRTFGMFSSRKLVVLEPADNLLKARGSNTAEIANEDDDEDKEPASMSDGTSARDLILRYAEAPSENTTLVLICDNWLKTTRLHKFLDKHGAVIFCQPMKEEEVPRWLTQHARADFGKTLEPLAAMRLAELVGSDLARLESELAKLALFSDKQSAITPTMVDELVGFQHEQVVWGFIDALAAGNAKEALARHAELWEMDARIGFSLVGAVYFWLSQALRAREMLDRRLSEGQIIKELRLWPGPKATAVMNSARRWGVEGCRRVSTALLAADMAAKTSLGDPQRNMERFIVQACLGLEA